MEIIFRETRRCESIKILDTARKRTPGRRSLSFDYTFEPLASSSATNTATFAHALHIRRNTRKVRSDSSFEGEKLSRIRLERPALKSLECFEARTILLFRRITLCTLDREKFRKPRSNFTQHHHHHSIVNLPDAPTNEREFLFNSNSSKFIVTSRHHANRHFRGGHSCIDV